MIKQIIQGLIITFVDIFSIFIILQNSLILIKEFFKFLFFKNNEKSNNKLRL